jgi:hypothetical protein
MILRQNPQLGIHNLRDTAHFLRIWNLMYKLRGRRALLHILSSLSSISLWNTYLEQRYKVSKSQKLHLNIGETRKMEPIMARNGNRITLQVTLEGLSQTWQGEAMVVRIPLGHQHKS